ncbi:DNA N-6-adenine-methyltransferase [Gallibacterium genomosp. 1]|uniref:DNA N-6-adenine-methyltransferase n=1 Tax=Gallibacterium genomosp. 1 TaxID=155515 RepID=UPI000802721B|nr:DNA N-6-adenine-methyltransferase [Gallibacterium genomosp. 1]OBX02219.1 adenine methyltransferase [Gallibacterium genomosp. 1]
MEFDKDTYRTPKYIINYIRIRYGYWNAWVDGCASPHNAVFDSYIGKSGLTEDFLDFDPLAIVGDFADHSVCFFVNPPYSNPLPYVKRAAELKELGFLVVMLLPCDKSVEWFKVIEEKATEVIDITGYYDEKGRWKNGRISFLHPTENVEVKGNNKGSMMAVFDPTMQGFVTRQVSLDFVMKCGGYGN